MADKHSQNFDLAALLRSGNLDVRGLAENNSSFSVGEYYNSLSKFIAIAPAVNDALAQVAKFAGDKNDIQNLADIKILLSDIGCNKFIPVIDDILDAYKKGKMTFAASYAEKFLSDFNRLYTQTMSAKTTPESGIPAIESSLKVVLKQLDLEEVNRKPLVLAVDDASVMLKTIIAALSGDYKVYGLPDPMKLEKILCHMTPELFLLDYNMPGRSGFDLVPVIRGFEEHKDTPIIFVTSMNTFDHLSNAVALGACDFVIKPIQPDLLREKVAKHIVRKKLF